MAIVWRGDVSAVLVATILAAPGPADAAVRHVFVTSTSGTGDFSQWPGNLDGGLTGLAAANKICQSTAASSSLPAIAAASASFRAWISTPTTDAFCNVLGFTGTKASACGGSFTTQKRGPWARPDELGWADELSEMTGASRVYHPTLFDEDGVELNLTDVYHWTGTDAAGVAKPDTCTGWTAGSSVSGAYGRSLITTGSAWSFWNEFVCNQTARLLCLEGGGVGDPVNLDQGPGALAFVTSATGNGNPQTWAQSSSTTGIAGADKICQKLATDAHLPSPGTFVAWVSTDSVNAVDRLTTNGPFRRIDGSRIATNKTTLVDDFRETTLHLAENGSYLPSRRVFTGTNWNGVKSSLDCADWTVSTHTSVTTGDSYLFAHNWSEGVSSEWCDDLRSFYCFSNVISIFWNGFEDHDPAWSDSVGLP